MPLALCLHNSCGLLLLLLLLLLLAWQIVGGFVLANSQGPSARLGCMDLQATGLSHGNHLVRCCFADAII